ncbi:pilus assembly PilX N-terminal domain-containing protein [Candidatus Peregrinibacteria bacterium]|nr:pilus assembly PilX N-terminal domain-containing protein [Candidatus Peregrinibacteria bacterium]
MQNKLWKNSGGTALLVALLVMSVLMTVSVLLSRLVLRETQIVKKLIDSGRAYYAAESGVELALYGLAQNLPGWEAENSFKVDEKAVGEYAVDNRCNAYPCFEKGYDLNGVEAKEFYGALDLNESVNVPLFVVDEEGVPSPVENFTVEFFATFDPKTDLDVALRGGELSGWDVMRWKVFGINEMSAVTETISDFTALSMQNMGGEFFTTNAQNPSWFGTKDCDELTGRYADDIHCAPYVAGYEDSLVAIDTEAFGQVSKIYAGICSQTEAREYYAYQYIGDGRELAAINGCYSIKKFLDEHNLNYLSLTNLINPAVFKERSNEAFRKLYYRVEFGEGETSRQYADVTAHGYSGNSRQNINVQMKDGSFMPVFHFSLYSTYKE